MVSKLKKPRRVMMLVKAGQAVDAFIDLLVPLLEAGDIIIDGGNSEYTDSNVSILYTHHTLSILPPHSVVVRLLKQKDCCLWAVELVEVRMELVMDRPSCLGEPQRHGLRSNQSFRVLLPR